ncbi:hypothetical protein [Streptomyces sp. Ru87]|uniref:hypothetical protein n=1 Tax=Streptomyces sp. Ru87 TaxID=2044307 RepID=UPI000BF5A892|nr:hypothetical protein [Streptomyces sp. Ru87]PGH50391.1 hypothetical protein CRI70_12345 [Streptomyces sp. Ru87]
MSHQQPPPPSGPYDGGQQHNPYAAGPPPQQPGYGYPQGAQPGPQGHAGVPPQGGPGYGYPPAGAPGAPGGQPWPPQAPPPSRGLGKGAIIGIAAGALVVLLAVGFGVVSMLGGPEGTEKLTAPQTLLDGDYEKAPDSSQLQQQRDMLQDELPSDGTAVVAQYTQGGDATKGALILSGAWGDIDSDPADTRKDALDGMAQGQGAEVVQSPKDFGSGDDVLSCQVLKATQGLGELYMPACAWSDNSTMAVVAVVSPDYTSEDSVNLDEYADTVSKVRDETVQPK